ncbi:MAG: RNA polymerase sigma factor RpoD/SigA [Spirochaetia bacterium]|jgi:RNA polymerase primary sigma factor|nr:RNA polymerase sigma factor RpoD/SigA [Spirochaetia bacterium]
MNKRTKKRFACDDECRQYFSQIKASRLLSFEEELELSRRIQKGDSSACTRLIEANLRLVVKIAKGYMQSGVDIMDLIQEGNIGLITAAKKYDYKKNVRFCTYAAWWIKQGVSRFLATRRRQIRLPYRKDEALRKIQKARLLLAEELRRSPSVDEIAETTGIGRQDILHIMNMPSTVVSLDARRDTASGNLHDTYEDYTFSPEKEVLEKVMSEELRRSVDVLQQRERQVLMHRFAFYGNPRHTLKDLSSMVGVSPETIRKIEMRAVRKIREEAQPLAEYMYN